MARGKARGESSAKSLVRLDINGLMRDFVGQVSGLGDEDFAALEPRLAAISQALAEERRGGGLAFAALPFDKKTHAAVRGLCERLRGRFDDLVVLGIGGSALGARALYGALRPAFHRESPGEGEMRLSVCDNVDPSTFAALLDRLDLRRTLFNVVSKSGQTAETMAQFLYVRDRLLSVLGAVEYSEHVVVTTDQESGYLRQIVNDEGFASLPIPPGVGGRFSVLSPVGIFPAACAGIDTEKLLLGAAAMARRCEGFSGIFFNPAYLLGAALYLAHTRRGRTIAVMMPYSDRLAALAEWFCQLWAESLGKELNVKGERVKNGQTPVRALGATDQHSQLQLYAEGPEDKVIIFVRVEEHGSDFTIPRAYEDLEGVRYLGGLTLGGLLNMEQRGTELALAKRGCPTMVLELPAVTEAALGELIFLLEYATVVAGFLYEVNPFDQPGVEEGKRLTYGLAGRGGFEAERAEVERWLAKKESKYIL